MSHQMTDGERKKLGAHYDFSFKGIKVDVYRVLEIFKVTNSAQQHAIKKLLRAGRSVKTLRQDIQEVILSLQRWLEMLDEDEAEVGDDVLLKVAAGDNGGVVFSGKVAEPGYIQEPELAVRGLPNSHLRR